jgi:uncharacterized RDD family membrane protein YckC
MNDNYDMNNMPAEGTPEHDEYMRSQFGEEYEFGYRIGFGRRFGATFIDFIITSIIGFLVILMTGALEVIMNMDDLINNMPQLIIVLKDSTLISGLLILVYYTTEIFIGASPGKMILGIVIADSNRYVAELNKLVKRYLLKHLNSILSVIALITSISYFETISSLVFLILVVGFFFTLSNKRQALHDSLTDTAVYFKENIKNY